MTNAPGTSLRPAASSTANAADLPFVFPTPRAATYGNPLPITGFDWSGDESLAGLSDATGRALGASTAGGLAVRVTSTPTGNEQGYRLRITAAGVAIEAGDEAGIRNAVLSLAQLVSTGDDGALAVREAEIDDHPTFLLRGLIGDTTVLRWMAPFKFNLLQHPGFRGPLQGTVLDDTIAEAESLGAMFLTHLGYKGSFDTVSLTATEHELQPVIDYYLERQARGAKAFTVAFDDQPFPLGEGTIFGENHARACRAVYDALRQVDPDCKIWFCGVPYAGDPETFMFECELEDGRAYLAEAKTLPDDVEIYWTGDNVFSPSMTGTNASKYGEAIGRRPFIWDNDSCTWVTQLKPLSGRTPDLGEAGSGYVANVGDPAYSMYVTPTIVPVLMSIADFAWNPEAYDETTALETAFRFLGGEARVETLTRSYAAARAPRVGTSLPATRAELGTWSKDIAGLRHAAFEDSLRDVLESF